MFDSPQFHWSCGEADDAEFGPVLMLFPGEWYRHIPSGYEVVDIMFQKEPFCLGETDDDIRYGCLSYGVLAEDDSAVALGLKS